MSEMKECVAHTPGPWKSDRGVDDDPTRCFVTQAIQGQPEYVIAEIQNGAPGDCLETEVANARLIAAAPDLLLASREILSNYGPPSEYDQPYREMWERLSTAIAKAEGR